MPDLRQQSDLHPNRVPHATPLGWISNRRKRMVSVDLSPALRALQFEKQFGKAVIAHAKWAVKRHLSNIKRGGMTLSNDDRVLGQIMASYGVREEVREYAVLKLRLGVLNAV